MNSVFSKIAYVFGILLMAFGCSSAKAQSGEKPGKAWFVASFGPGTPQPFSGGASFSFGRKVQYQLAVNANSRMGLFGTPPYVASISGAIGTGYSSGTRRASVFAGPTFVWGLLPEERKENGKTLPTGGIILNAQYFLVLMKSAMSTVGVGLDLYVNVNPAWNGAGARLALSIGSAE